jgi:uncharacterized YccA/Bax inhibitor family protein
VRTTNPMLTRLSADAARERAATQPPAYGQPYSTGVSSYPTVEGAAPPSVRPMTVDDVVIRTIGLLALVLVSAGGVWLGTEPAQGLAFALPAMLVGLVLGLVIAFARVTTPIS